MKLLRLEAGILSILLLLSSCAVGDPRDTDDAVITETLTVAEPTIDDYINGEAPFPAMNALHLIGDDMQTEMFADKNCAVVYNERGAWMFDYELSKVTPLVDVDEMLAAADPLERGREYFDDVRLTYEFSELSGSVLIDFTVTSNENSTHTFAVHSQYITGQKVYIFDRGYHNAYTYISASFPGSDEPIAVTSLDDFDRLCLANDPQNGLHTINSHLVDIVRAFITNDVPALEERLFLDSGILSIWEGTVISDFTVYRDVPIMNGISELSLEFTIEKSTVERYPEGKYRMRITDGIKIFTDIERLDAEPDDKKIFETSERAQRHALIWGTEYGGYMTREQQDPNDPGFAHAMLEYFGTVIAPSEGITDGVTGNMYREYAKKYLNIYGVDNEYTAYGDKVIEHGAHGGSGVLAEVEKDFFASGVHFVTVNFYADPFKSVVARTRTFVMMEYHNFDGDTEYIYWLDHTEFDYDSDLPLYAWAV